MAQYVMTSGTLSMPLWSAINYTTHPLVSAALFICSIINSGCACTARVTVLCLFKLCVCVSVCLSVTMLDKTSFAASKHAIN